MAYSTFDELFMDANKYFLFAPNIYSTSYLCLLSMYNYEFNNYVNKYENDKDYLQTLTKETFFRLLQHKHLNEIKDKYKYIQNCLSWNTEYKRAKSGYKLSEVFTLLTVKESAKYLNLSKSSIYRMIPVFTYVIKNDSNQYVIAKYELMYHLWRNQYYYK